MQALALLPTPLPGLETPAALLPLLAWARQLLMSPRLFEADAGARIVSLVADDYVTRLGWRVTLWPAPAAVPPPAGAPGGGSGRVHPCAAAAAFELLRELAAKAAGQAELAGRDLAAAACHGLAHGPLLAARYVCEALPWEPVLAAAATGAPAARAEAAAAVAALLAAARAAAAAALPPLSRQDRNVAAGDVDADDADADDADADDAADADEDGNDEGAGGEGLGPVPQLVNTACWTTLKEVAGVTQALVCGLPLPQGGGQGHNQSGAAAAPLLSVAQVEAAGGVLLELLLHLKHNGAVDKVQASFAVICGKLLRSEAPELRRLPAAWLARCFEHMLRPGAAGVVGGAGRGPCRAQLAGPADTSAGPVLPWCP
jgi:hypothetical protein